MTTAQHARLAAKILGDRDRPGRFHTAQSTPLRTDPPGSSIPTTRIMRRAALDLGQSKADRGWYSALPGKVDPDRDDYRDAMGAIKGDDGCTVRPLDYRRRRDSRLAD